MVRAKKKLLAEHAEPARIAFFYGIDPYRLTRSQRRGLLWNIPRLQAEETLRDMAAKTGRMTADLLHRLVHQATGDEAQADQARFEFLAAQLRAGATPET